VIDGIPYCHRGHACTPDNLKGYGCRECITISVRANEEARKKKYREQRGDQFGKRRVQTVTLEWLRERCLISENGCWLWTMGREGGGYGVVSSGGKRQKAHRLAWEIVNGPAPDGLFVCHRCDLPACINPDHLFVGSHAENMQDMLSKGRGKHASKTHCPKGHPYSGDNLAVYRGRHRNCRTCINDRSRARYARTRAALPPDDGGGR
jgi:hypothetical protein